LIEKVVIPEFDSKIKIDPENWVEKNPNGSVTYKKGPMTKFAEWWFKIVPPKVEIKQEPQKQKIIPAKKMKRMWTKAEVKYIEDNYGIIPIKEIAEDLEATYYQVWTKIHNNSMKPHDKIK
jgi:hypothetical protein